MRPSDPDGMKMTTIIIRVPLWLNQRVVKFCRMFGFTKNRLVNELLMELSVNPWESQIGSVRFSSTRKETCTRFLEDVLHMDEIKKKGRKEFSESRVRKHPFSSGNEH